eukprot:361434-Lingulodinium_polyedra.AAC.1
MPQPDPLGQGEDDAGLPVQGSIQQDASGCVELVFRSLQDIAHSPLTLLGGSLPGGWLLRRCGKPQGPGAGSMGDVPQVEAKVEPQEQPHAIGPLPELPAIHPAEPPSGAHLGPLHLDRTLLKQSSLNLPR